MKRMRHGSMLAALLGVTALAYLPGLSGPFLLDDTTTSLQTAPLRPARLSPHSPLRAARPL